MAPPTYPIKHFKVMPGGKLPEISLPPDWNKYAGDNLSKFVKLKNGDTVADGPSGRPLTITTVPPRSHSGKDDPDGHTEFFYLSEETRSKVFDYPGFPKPVNTPKLPKYEVREAPGKGRGVYATCDMYPGDLIWAERPLIVFIMAIMLPKGLRIGSHHTEGQQQALKLCAGERTVEAVINRLTPERKARFMSLANAHKENGSGPCTGILRTNQLEIRMVEGNPGSDHSETLRYTAVGDILSLTNHSCIPNIKNDFDFASFSLQIYARAHIKKGDELVWSYIDGSGLTAAQRQQDLSAYGFRCKCRICLDPELDLHWNSFRSRSLGTASVFMKALLKEDLDDPFHKKSPAKQEAKLKDYKDMIATLKALESESNSYGFAAKLYWLCLLHELYKRVGNETKRRRYVNLVVRWTKCEDIEFWPYI